MKKGENVKHALEAMGWGGQAIPNVPGLRDEESTGSAARDLQTGFDWGKAYEGFDRWDLIYRDIKEWEDNRVTLKPSGGTGPTSYHSLCLFRVTGFTVELKDGAGTEFREQTPMHFVGLKRGDHWQFRDANGNLQAFENPPNVDAWAYLD
jgi:hypothetical protein